MGRSGIKKPLRILRTGGVISTRSREHFGDKLIPSNRGEEEFFDILFQSITLVNDSDYTINNKPLK